MLNCSVKSGFEMPWSAFRNSRMWSFQKLPDFGVTEATASAPRKIKSTLQFWGLRSHDLQRELKIILCRLKVGKVLGDACVNIFQHKASFLLNTLKRRTQSLVLKRILANLIAASSTELTNTNISKTYKVHISVGATIRQTRLLPRVPSQRGRQKIQLCGSESDERTPREGMNIMKVNETHDHAVYEKTKVLHCFRCVAEGVIFLLLISISHTLGKLCRNLV